MRTLGALLEHLWPGAFSEEDPSHFLSCHVQVLGLGFAYPCYNDFLVGVLEVVTGW